jgi:outer membrane lipoprotein-sorting protein
MWGKLLVLMSGVALLALGAGAQTVDEVIAKNIAAHGGLEKMKAVESLRMAGRMTFGAMEASAVMEVKRPASMRMEITLQGMTIVQAYDGKTGWQIVPFTGKLDPEPMSPDELKDAEENADMDGPLVDYKAKGHQVELLGKESVEGTPCYKLKVTRKNGNVTFFYLDVDTGLEIRSVSKRMIRGTETELDTSYGDYKEVGGLMLPHTVDQGAVGRPERQKIIIDKIEINPTIDNSRFAMPAPKPAEAKP